MPLHKYYEGSGRVTPPTFKDGNDATTVLTWGLESRVLPIVLPKR